jgi:salicylate hydroxylase
MMRVLVVGAGIGGLTAALALRQSGFDVHVYEQARVLREVGAGLALGSNAVRVLHRLGLADELRGFGVRSESWDFRDWHSGEILGRVPLGDAAESRWGAPFYNAHRAALHDALRAAVGDEHISLGACCVSVEQVESRVAIGFADGRDATGDLLVGADGVHSIVREYVAGPDQPTWWPQVAWRGLAPGAIGREIGLETRQQMFVGPNSLFVTYYVSSGRLVNWIVPTPSDGWGEESWSALGDRDDALRMLEGWHPQVRTLIANTEQVFKWAMFDRPSLETWNRGRVTLLGDAAHPMLPFMGQGAAQSIEDASALARCLADDRDDAERAIARYAAIRRDRAGAMQAASRQQGRDLQLSDAGEIAARNAQMVSPDSLLARYDWAWGYDIDEAVHEGEPRTGVD